MNPADSNSGNINSYDGALDEEKERELFQAAVMEWRRGQQGTEKETENEKGPKDFLSSQRFNQKENILNGFCAY